MSMEEFGTTSQRDEEQASSWTGERSRYITLLASSVHAKNPSRVVSPRTAENTEQRQGPWKLLRNRWLEVRYDFGLKYANPDGVQLLSLILDPNPFALLIPICPEHGYLCLSVSHFLLWTAAAAAYLGVAASGGRGQTRISLSSSSTNIQQSNTGVSSLGQSSSMRFNWDKRTKNMKTTLLTKLTSNWSPSKALTLPYEIPLGKVRWNVREPDNKCTKAFMRLEKIHLKKGYKEIGGNCMDLVKGALNFLGKRGKQRERWVDAVNREVSKGEQLPGRHQYFFRPVYKGLHK
ncbi:hypothetical protein EV359DRAFT_62545 [Lentinula novae-zelandiae]|nr:hypothetical protein EV359DRAFT_62545 [Lentinula novae-zelandiae]